MHLPAADNLAVFPRIAFGFSGFPWNPYAVNGVAHPGVWIAGLEESDGNSLTAKFEPEGSTIPHTHSGTETITILEGKAEFVMHGRTQILKEGDSVTVTENALHSLRNAGKKALYVYAEFNPPFQDQQTVLSS